MKTNLINISEDSEVVAQRNGIQDYKSLIDMVRNALDKFKEYAAELKIGQKIIVTLNLIWSECKSKNSPNLLI